MEQHRQARPVCASTLRTTTRTVFDVFHVEQGHWATTTEAGAARVYSHAVPRGTVRAAPRRDAASDRGVHLVARGVSAGIPSSVSTQRFQPGGFNSAAPVPRGTGWWPGTSPRGGPLPWGPGCPGSTWNESGSARGPGLSASGRFKPTVPRGTSVEPDAPCWVSSKQTGRCGTCPSRAMPPERSNGPVPRGTSHSH